MAPSDLQIDHKTLHEKNVELAEMYRGKSKKQAQTQYLYDTLKKRVMTSQVQTIASDSVAQAIGSTSGIPAPQVFGDPAFELPQTSNFYPVAHGGNDRHQQTYHSRNSSHPGRPVHAEASSSGMLPPQGPMGGHHPRKSFVLAAEFSLIVLDGLVSSTPQHRTHLPGTVRTAATRSQIPLSTRAPGVAQRQPLVNITTSRNSQSGSSGYGISAGMKVGRPPRSNVSADEHTLDKHNGIAMTTKGQSSADKASSTSERPKWSG